MQTADLTVDLSVADPVTGRQRACLVTAREQHGACEVVVRVEGGAELTGCGTDFEDALQHLRLELESRRLLLLCNRFRRDAFVSSLSRGMSNGLACYLVVLRRPVDPARIVPCLGRAPVEDVVTDADARAHIEDWKASTVPPPLVRWLRRLRPASR